MKYSLTYYLFEAEDIDEAMAISAGGASLASSGQIVGGPMLPIGMKPGEKVKKRKKGKVISASPAVHDKNALALQEDVVEESFGAMHEPDFKGPSMPGLWKGLEDEEEPVKTSSPALHATKKKETLY